MDESITTLTSNVDSILQDPEIDMVVEVMGGTGLAKRVVLDALAQKKAVVTANKALVAEHLQELKEACLKTNTILAYEAAVCGGIPIIQTLHTCYTGDVIQEIMVLYWTKCWLCECLIPLFYDYTHVSSYILSFYI